MTKYLATGAAFVLVAGLMTGAAMAQDESSTTQTTTTNSPGYVTDRTKTQSERVIDSNGTVIDKSRTIQSGDGTMSARTTESVRQPDGVVQQQRTTSQERTTTVAPVAPPVASTTTTTHSTTSSSGYPN